VLQVQEALVHEGRFLSIYHIKGLFPLQKSEQTCLMGDIRALQKDKYCVKQENHEQTFEKSLKYIIDV